MPGLLILLGIGLFLFGVGVEKLNKDDRDPLGWAFTAIGVGLDVLSILGMIRFFLPTN